jgi:hypothetical protein
MRITVYIEAGAKRTFAGAIEWPGWCRSGKDEASALQALLEYGPRYERVLRGAATGFQPPRLLSDLRVVERVKGSTTTDFGAPDAAPKSDAEALNEAALPGYEKLLKRCWKEFDAAVKEATGKALRTGPRGGGRELQQMVDHVLEADAAYLSRLGWPFKRAAGRANKAALEAERAAILEGLLAASRGEIAAKGPRGGKRWSPRYFIRRSAWHVLDHAWEIQDRLG